MAQANRQVGTVKWFNQQKGFGFIMPKDGREDIFVHQTSIKSDGYRSLSEGEIVEFSVEHGEDGRTKAVDVTGPDGTILSGGGARRVPGGRGRAGVRGRSGGGRSYSNGGTCYTCGKNGHMARDCQEGGGGRYASGGEGRYNGSGGGGRYGGGCYNCGAQGHFARECPNAD